MRREKKTNLYPSSKRLRGILLIWVTASKLSTIVNSLVVKRFNRLVGNLATGWKVVSVVLISGSNGLMNQTFYEY